MGDGNQKIRLESKKIVIVKSVDKLTSLRRKIQK